MPSQGIEICAPREAHAHRRVRGERGRFSRRIPKQKAFCRPLVEWHPLSMFAAGGPPRSGLVLGYGAIATEDIDKGLRRLRSSFDD